MKQVVQTLQLALEKEKTKVKDLKEQVGSWCVDCTPFSICLSDESRVFHRTIFYFEMI